ncbi:uncharacterized protein CTRU02_202668 [Colletotrichum truncatum]|uniref:Uncharacterized protein n=1 Tax=Colletotrichum truncatum TaxID=5467 RepID=A0ACC3ZKX3_COLTU|nr:uncharacterized protein CTRU02_10591 [Colletotrichum truncatum]KAF6786892.1 hypothetical protein CTRU02_10591 [Colletotrichum truncatum]
MSLSQDAAHTISEMDSDEEPLDPRWIRRANATSIMYDEIIPDMPTEDSKPYCIWEELASEETYRKLFRRYPDMRYQVGRACAAAGYDSLYDELDLLPDVSIAEEAREANISGSRQIFDKIMSHPVRYAVMDDYTRTISISNPHPGACLNGDTAVRASLLTDYEGEISDEMRDPHYFDITEDIGPSGRHAGHRNMDHQVLPPQFEYLLWSPLPKDLPTTRKDALIIMAAYEGNLDRYLRLRRPVMVADEWGAVIRGIYHNTTFAKWWSLQDPATLGPDSRFILEAINARFIMNNDLSRIRMDSADKDDVPDMFWYPLIPQERTLRELVRRRPNAVFSVALACIAADYQHTYDALDVAPHYITYQQARMSHNPHYALDLERRASERNIDLHPMTHLTCRTRPAKEPTSLAIEPEIRAYRGALIESHVEGIYPSELQANAASWELFICVPEDLKRRAGAGDIMLYPESDDLDAWKAAIAKNISR